MMRLRRTADDMAALRGCVLSACGILPSKVNSLGHCLQQVRNYVGCRMIRDEKRRRWAKEYAVERLRLLTLKRNNVLPIEIRELASKEFDEKIPRQTALRQLTPRCVVTSRGRVKGNVLRWRVSRFIFRDLIDYNKMAGMQRAIW